MENPPLQALVEAFEFYRNDENALAMAKYMKDRFSFYGIKSPLRREIQREWVKIHYAPLSVEDKKKLILALYQLNQREFHYVAIDLLNTLPKKAIFSEDIRLTESMLITHTWWDSLDSIAANHLGKLFALHPEIKDIYLDKWRKSPNFWLNRACLLFQLKYREQTNFSLLTELIEEFNSNKEFFIQKAIGWTLREYSKTNPVAVREYLGKGHIKGLALREASKYI